MMRRLSDTERIRTYRHPGRRWLAIGMVALSIIAAIWLFSRDIEWENRRREARLNGLSAEANGNYQAAREFFELALANHPYDWKTHLSLARILNHRLGDYTGAMRHYYYALGYTPEPSAMQDVRSELEVLDMIRRGELENPRDAIEDMFLAMEAGTEQLFRYRLSRRLKDDFSAYWNAWRQRGRGDTVYCRIRNEKDGFFDANVDLVFPDATSMSMHLYCVKNQVWRLEISFP